MDTAIIIPVSYPGRLHHVSVIYLFCCKLCQGSRILGWLVTRYAFTVRKYTAMYIVPLARSGQRPAHTISVAVAGQFLQRYRNLLYATVPDLVQCYDIDTNDMPVEMVTFNIPTPPGLTRRMEAYATDTHTDLKCSRVLLDTFIDTGRGSSQATGIATRTYSRKQVRRSLGRIAISSQHLRVDPTTLWEIFFGAIKVAERWHKISPMGSRSRPAQGWLCIRRDRVCQPSQERRASAPDSVTQLDNDLVRVLSL